MMKILKFRFFNVFSCDALLNKFLRDFLTKKIVRITHLHSFNIQNWPRMMNYSLLVFYINKVKKVCLKFPDTIILEKGKIVRNGQVLVGVSKSSKGKGEGGRKA